MKKIYSLLIALILFLGAKAQFNQQIDIEVQAVISPSSSQTYNTVDTFDIIIRIKNNGPSTLIPGDEFKVSYTVGDGTANTVTVDTLLLVGDTRSMQVGEGRTYTLAKDFIINGNNIYSACADVSGTTQFPTNTNKFPGECERFVVDLNENLIQINKAYFSQNKVIVNLNDQNIHVLNIYDITGKLIVSRSNISAKEVSIPFEKKAKGFYFVTVAHQNGSQSTAKFVVNQ
jgi:hypothetical protein